MPARVSDLLRSRATAAPSASAVDLAGQVRSPPKTLPGPACAAARNLGRRPRTALSRGRANTGGWPPRSLPNPGTPPPCARKQGGTPTPTSCDCRSCKSFGARWCHPTRAEQHEQHAARCPRFKSLQAGGWLGDAHATRRSPCAMQRDSCCNYSRPTRPSRPAGVASGSGAGRAPECGRPNADAMRSADNTKRRHDQSA